ncbi:eukaryotic translation initiation factor 2-alpha kinase isoform X2 [Anabrus simplex]|uniref:eukaryotic translation initiation factor 2-alpha kinase isoform X2 n=1 Tax=Anabrus simplex TaxID=316456 RepID=UPI0035A3350F
MEIRLYYSITRLLLFVFTLIIFVVCGASEDGELNGLPYCNPDSSSSKYDHEKYVFVSTLDGRLSALNAKDGGTVAWSINTGPGPLLSSSIHRLELENNGHLVRMIPSLRGGLYKFNGDNIEVVPITADRLLQSSFLFSDDLVISGGKESRSYGISMKTGRILYECSIQGCDNYTEGISVEKDVLVIQRQTQTVRAIEARNGQERWNFSVGLHDLKFIYDPNASCHTLVRDSSLLDLELKVVVPEGLICAVSKSNPEKLLWKQKFDAPVVAAWHFKEEKMNSVDLFSGSQSTYDFKDEMGPISPSLYIGMHKKQLYIQESVTMLEIFDRISWSSAGSSNYLQIPWKPIPATSTALGMVSSPESETALQVVDASTTAMSVLYASEYVNGNGFYLLTKDALERANGVKCDAGTKENITIEAIEEEHPNNYEFSEDDTPVQIMIVSLWYWWKEVLIISITTAILVNLIVTQRILQYIQLGSPTKEIVTQKIIVVEKPVTALSDTAPHVDHHLPIRSVSEPNGQLLTDFTSRYLTDFEPIHCLGKGGFGIVFEAKNKIDECNYAIKRIALPNRQESRDRVMREVKALAKLDHHHIVRYFNAWLECPPPGWQEEHDKFFNSYDDDATSIDLTGLSKGIIDSDHNTFNESFNDKNNSAVFLNIHSNQKLLENDSTHDTYENTVDKSESFIVFEASGNAELSGGDNLSLHDSVITVSCSESEESSPKRCNSETSTSSFCKLRKNVKRPYSLNLNGEGEVIPVKASRVYLYIQMQLCHKESLREWLRENTEVRDIPKVLHMFEQIIQAVEYVHLQGLIHRDLKMNGQPYDYKVDIYSLGLILFELLVPFGTQMERIRTLMDLRQNKFPKDFPHCYAKEYELLQQMLSHNPVLRPTTFGIRARPPFSYHYKETTEEQWHFELPPRRRDSARASSNSSSFDA